MMFMYLFNDVTEVLVNISLSVDGVALGVSVSVILQEEVLEGHQVFLFKRDHPLVAEAEGHQLRRGRRQKCVGRRVRRQRRRFRPCLRKLPGR